MDYIFAVDQSSMQISGYAVGHASENLNPQPYYNILPNMLALHIYACAQIFYVKIYAGIISLA